MPKISEEGKEVEILTAMLGEVERFSTSSSSCWRRQLAARWLPVRKRTFCAEAPINRSVSNANVVRKRYPIMLEVMGKLDGSSVFASLCFQG